MSNQVSVSLDKRRVEQLAKLAEMEGVKLAQWLEARISAEWRKAFPDQPVPGVRIWQGADTQGNSRVHLSFGERLVDEQGELEIPPVVVSPDLAQKIAFGLRGIALREITNFKTALEVEGEGLHIRRQGPGVRIADVRNSALWAGTPSMAVEIADCIELVAKVR